MASPPLLKGSFRGVPFGAFSHSLEGGRRTATHEFPFRNDSYTEDLGRKVRTFQLELFAIGDDFAGRDAIRKALEQSGPGTLVHPWLGTLNVQVQNFTLSEQYEARRLAPFSVTFIQPGKLDFPSSATNPSGAVNSASTAASLQAGANALAIDTSAPQASVAMGELAHSVSQIVVTAAQQAAKPSGLSTATATQTAIQAVSAFQAEAMSTSALVATPDLMSYQTADVVFQLSSLGMTSLQGFAAYQRLLGSAQALFGSLNFPATAIGSVQAANALLYQAVVYTAIVGSAASCAVGAAYTTLAQAIQTQQALRSMFDVAMGVVLDDTLFGQLQDLRASALTAIPDPTQSLPSVVVVSIAAPAPSLVLSHDLMTGSADEQTIIDLNDVGNPWFVPGGGPLKVQILQ